MQPSQSNCYCFGTFKKCIANVNQYLKLNKTKMLPHLVSHSIQICFTNCGQSFSHIMRVSLLKVGLTVIVQKLVSNIP